MTAGGLFVAGRGSSEHDGLHRFELVDGHWSGTLLATVEQLAALVWHPTLPVIYGVSGVGGAGSVHAWGLIDGAVAVLTERSSNGVDPCHLAVSPDGRLLVVANYTSSSLATWALSEDGSLAGEGQTLSLSGAGLDPHRQEASHPHHVLFEGHRLRVVDLGADLLRVFEVTGVAPYLSALESIPMPRGTGPRHLAELSDRRVALSGELAATMMVGYPDESPTTWASAPSTYRVGAATTRSTRNYPGDIQASANGAFAYLANRGYDTVSTFDVRGATPRLVAEVDTAAWPQHLLVTDDSVLVACWDGSKVVALPL
ncbi:MAG: beta-propeller fold lactonase family protein [Pseudolysinimonas sp.]